jgi:hypothetical protein
MHRFRHSTRELRHTVQYVCCYVYMFAADLDSRCEYDKYSYLCLFRYTLSVLWWLYEAIAVLVLIYTFIYCSTLQNTVLLSLMSLKYEVHDELLGTRESKIEQHVDCQRKSSTAV